ncbi:MAG: PKD domain-containing protein [Gammaproteobacteria bacterium]
MEGASALSISNDDRFVYVTSQSTNTLSVFERISGGGGLTLVQTVENGADGVRGMVQPSDVEVTPDGKYVLVTGADGDAVVVFERNADTGKLLWAQTVRNDLRGVRGLHMPTSVTSVGSRVFVGSLVSSGLEPGGLASFNVDPNPSPPFRLVTTHENMEGLTVATGSGDDTFLIRNPATIDVVSVAAGVEATFSDNDPAADTISRTGGSWIADGFEKGKLVAVAGLSANNGVYRIAALTDTVLTLDAGDAVTGETATGVTLTVLPETTLDSGERADRINLPSLGGATLVNGGGDGDTIDLRSGAPGIGVVIDGQDGSDTVNVWRTGEGSRTTIRGGNGEDTIRVTGKAIGSDVRVLGDDPVLPADPGDTLRFDPQSPDPSTPNFTPETPTFPDGTVKVNGDFATVRYASIESRVILNPPIPDALGPYAMDEGQSLQLLATSLVPIGGPATFHWDLNGDGDFGDVPETTGNEGDTLSLTVPWNDLVSLGIADDGTFPVTLRVIDGDGELGEASTVLTVGNADPSFTVAGEVPVDEGHPVTLVVTAADPGGARDPLRYDFDFDDDGAFELSNDTGVAAHTFADNGLFNVTVRVQDDDGGQSVQHIKVPVRNVAPALTLSGAAVVSEGSPYTLNLLASDPAPDTINGWRIDWGDGTVDDFAGNPQSVQHTYVDNGTIAISASGTDEDGTYDGGTKEVTVVNVAPAMAGTAFSGPLLEGSETTLTVTATDPGANDVLAYEFDFDQDGVFEIENAGGVATHTFVDNGIFSVNVRVRDGDGGSVTDAIPVVIGNVAPSLVIDGAPTGDESTPYVLNLSASDPGMDTIQRWRIDWGDGTAETMAGSAGSAVHRFDGPEVYTISATASDEDGLFDALNTVTVEVANVPPSLSVAGGPSVDEGATYMLGLSATDPGDDTISSWQIAWGDGEIEIISGNPTSVPHIYADNGGFTIFASATDEDGTYDAGSLTVAVNNVPPAVSDLELSSPTVSEAGEITLMGTITDPGVLDTYSVLIDWGDGTTSEATVNGARVFTATHSYLDDNPSGTPLDEDTITATATDNDGGIGTASTSVTIENVAPLVAALDLSQAVIDENDFATVTGSFIDAGTLDTHTVIIDWGDGTSAEGSVDALTRTFAATHQYLDDDPTGTTSDDYVITATVTDDDAGSNSASTTVTVHNVAPIITSLTNSAEVAGGGVIGQPVTVASTFTDVGLLDSHRGTIDWGDGTVTDALISESDGSGTFSRDLYHYGNALG